MYSDMTWWPMIYESKWSFKDQKDRKRGGHWRCWTSTTLQLRVRVHDEPHDLSNPKNPSASSQAVCVTRFDQRMRHLWVIRAVFRGICGEIFALFQVRVGNLDTIPPWKVVGTLIILIAIALVLNIFLSWAFVTSLNCSVMCKPPWWFECYFRRSSWIHCWLLLAVLSDYFGQLVTSTFLLCKFWGLPGSTPVRPVSNVVLHRYKTATEFRFPRTAGGFPA